MHKLYDNIIIIMCVSIKTYTKQSNNFQTDKS